MSKAFTPAIAGTEEVKPGLPLHDPNIGWITAVYLDREVKQIDLSTALKESHLIDRVELGHAAATAGLYRILVSIAALKYQDTLNAPSRNDWREERLDLLESNEGFGDNWVEAYFETFGNRFYLIHSHFPFMQDPSIAQTFSTKNTLSIDSEESVKELRAEFAKSLGSINQMHYDATYVKPGQVEWKLPKEHLLDGAGVGTQVSELMSSLLAQTYGASATMRGTRSFLNDHELAPALEVQNQLRAARGMSLDERNPLAHDTHCSAHAFRTAIHYIVEAGSLFKTLILAISNENTDLIGETDVPFWEQPVNEYGFIGSNGKAVEWTELGQSTNSIRSSVNYFHLAALIVPSVDNDGTYRQIRRLRFDFKHLTTLDAKGVSVKMPFPLTWNPFVAVTPEGKAFKQTSPLSPSTSLSRTSIYRVAMLPQGEDFKKPQPLLDLTDGEVADTLGSDVKIRILIHAGDASQDKDFGSFSIATQDFSGQYDNPQALSAIEDWLAYATGEKGSIGPLLSLRFALKTAYGSPTGGMAANPKIKLDQYEDMFWAQYYTLFNENVSRSKITPVTERAQEIKDVTRAVFSNAVRGLEASSPFMVAKARSDLNRQMNIKFKKREV